MQTFSTVVVPATALGRAPASEVARLVAAHPDAGFVVGGTEGLPLDGIAAAVERLRAGLAGTERELTVRLASAQAADLARIRTAGADRVEWTVAAPTPAAALALHGEPDAFESLVAGMATAAGLGLRVQLRWPVSRRTTPGLADLPALAERSPPGTRLVLVPQLAEAGQAPLLDQVARHWPHALVLRGAANARLTVVRSALWPACLQGDAAAVEPVSARQLTEQGVAFVPACDGCPVRTRSGCAGVAPALQDALAASATPFAGWRAGPLDPTAARPPTGPLAFDPACVEVRGLVLGLRAAWRLSLPAADVAAFREAVSALGLHVAASDVALAARIGGRLEPAARGETGTALVVVAPDPDVAQDCLRQELANLLRPPPVTEAEYRADLRETLAVHRRLGAAYGYPACCVEAFCDAHTEVVHTARATDNAVALLRAHRRSRRFDPLLATLGGGLGARTASPLRHLPCRFDCPASLDLAHRLVADLRLHNPAWHAEQAQWPALPAIVLADGSFLLVGGEPVAPEPGRRAVAVTDIRAVRAHLAESGGERLAAALQPLLGDVADFDSLAARPGIGLEVRRGGVWQPVPLPDPGPVAHPSAFPLLLPFAASATLA